MIVLCSADGDHLASFDPALTPTTMPPVFVGVLAAHACHDGEAASGFVWCEADTANIQVPGDPDAVVRWLQDHRTCPRCCCPCDGRDVEEVKTD